MDMEITQDTVMEKLGSDKSGKAEFKLDSGQHAWNPQSTSQTIDGPAQVTYERQSSSGTISATVNPTT